MKIADEKQTLDFRMALNQAECGECGERLEWEAEFDADGTTYSAECCDYVYYMENATVTVDREPVET